MSTDTQCSRQRRKNGLIIHFWYSVNSNINCVGDNWLLTRHILRYYNPTNDHSLSLNFYANIRNQCEISGCLWYRDNSSLTMQECPRNVKHSIPIFLSKHSNTPCSNPLNYLSVILHTLKLNYHCIRLYEIVLIVQDFMVDMWK